MKYFLAALAEWTNMHDLHGPFPLGRPFTEQACAHLEHDHSARECVTCNKLEFVLMVGEFRVAFCARVAWQIVPEHAFNGWILQDPFCSSCCAFCIFFHPVFSKVGLRFISLPFNLLPELLNIILHTESGPLRWTRAVVDSPRSQPMELVIT